tara:strand:+ start:2241 stop:3644 length:1404 start_codon:yes stop_codon:yes gene_type:complete
MTEAQQLRQAILSAALETSNHGEKPSIGTLYIPLSHQKALRLDTSVVVGGRGVGKSFWTAALRDPELRATIGAVLPELDIDLFIGHSEKQDDSSYPTEDEFAQLLNLGYPTLDIWKAVIYRWVASQNQTPIPDQTWPDTLEWQKNSPHESAALMRQPRAWKGLILFDALDRISRDWQQMDDIVRGLLQAILWLKSFNGLYGKAFLREDQAERNVFDFPDASKLKASRADLNWARHDVHGLLWQRLINAPGEHGQLLREQLPSSLYSQHNGLYLLNDGMKRESEQQREAFIKLAGPWMGKDKRRGVPYTWSVSHLADGRGQASPRSFLAAIKEATEGTQERYPDHENALHYESIKRGIQKASGIRVSELEEDYPWISTVMAPLRGLTLPCEFSVFEPRWQDHFPQGPSSIPSERLPAQHSEKGWQGIVEDLKRLGVMETKKDGRIDMPDLYRVGFGLGRRGGVKPQNK